MLVGWWGPGALAICRAHWGLPIGFILLWCSVWFAVGSISLLYLLFVSCFVCSGGWYIDKLGVFRASQISMCLDPHLGCGWGWRRETGLSPPVRYLLTVPRHCFVCGSFVFFFCLVFVVPL